MQQNSPEKSIFKQKKEILKIFKCFISSPSDCEKEREICEAIINKINIGALATHLKINFKTFMWEYAFYLKWGEMDKKLLMNIL